MRVQTGFAEAVRQRSRSAHRYCPGLFFFSSRRRHTRLQGDWSSDVCSSDLYSLWGAHADSLLMCLLRNIRLLALIAIAALPASAYEEPLTSESIREAYFLGQRRDEATASVLARYDHYYPLPRTGPYISRVQVLTPY